VLLIAGCAKKASPPPPPAPPPAFTETPLPESGTAEFRIGPIKESRSADGATIFIEGTVANTGSRTSRSVHVQVEGLDATGGQVASADALPTPQEIEPGSVGTFLVRLPNDPNIRTYHVEAIGR
jgi:hypothetical protein